MINFIKKLFREPSSLIVEPEGNGALLNSKIQSKESLWDDFEERSSHSIEVLIKRRDLLPHEIYWLGSINYSGHVRERCLKYLIEHFEDGDENRILLRLCDWVPQVSILAEEWAYEHFQNLGFEQVSKNSKLLLYLSRKESLKNTDIMEHIEMCLMLLVARITEKDFFSLSQAFRYYLFLLSFQRDGYLRKWIFSDSDPNNRRLFLKCYTVHEMTVEERNVLSFDKSPQLRRSLLYSILKAEQIPQRDYLERLAFDKSYSIRLSGVYYLKQIYEVDCYQLYKETDAPSCFYVADYAKEEDIPLFKQGLISKFKHVRNTCLKAIMAINSEILLSLDIATLMEQSAYFRKLITPHLASLLTLDEILALKASYLRIPGNGNLAFICLVKRKSYWNHVEIGFKVIHEDINSPDVETILHGFMDHEISEALRLKQRERIEKYIQLFSQEFKKSHSKVFEWLNFVMN
ncbi:MAG: hypothetical protein ACSHX0_12345 [Akkermansiaceae bacterium]